MPSLRLRRRAARGLSAVVLVAAMAAAPALAQMGAAGLMPFPRRTVISGAFRFAAGHVGRHVRIVIFFIDGHAVWSTRHAPFRFGRTGWFDSARLSAGRHVLTVEVVSTTFHRRFADKVIFVSHPLLGGIAHTGSRHRRTRPPVAHTTGAPNSDVGAFGASGIAGPSVAHFSRNTYWFSTSWGLPLEASRLQFIVLAGNEGRYVAQLHALNPGLKVLLYQSVMHTNPQDYSYLQTVTGCTAAADDLANHPDWILHDQSGNLVVDRFRNFEYLTDVGNQAYQQQCAANAAALAKRYGFDGIFWDAVAGNLSWNVTPGLTVPAYPTPASWGAAMQSAVDYLGPALRAQGLISIGNVSSTANMTAWTNLVAPLDGVMEESWSDGGAGPGQQIPWFATKLAELQWTQAHGKYELLHSYNGTETENTYGLAGMLLAASGMASYQTSNTDYTSNENWFPEYDTAQQLGAPAGPYRVLSNGVYERAFTNGIVLVNPTAASIPTFSLGGHSFSGSGLSNATSVAMGPTSGLILLQVG